MFSGSRRVMLVLWLLVVATLCAYVPWRAEAQEAAMTLGYSVLWSPPQPPAPTRHVRDRFTPFAVIDVTRWLVGLVGATAAFAAVGVLTPRAAGKKGHSDNAPTRPRQAGDGFVTCPHCGGPVLSSASDR